MRRDRDRRQRAERIEDAITELTDALAEADADDISGFALQAVRGGSFLYESRSGAPTLTIGVFDQKQEPYSKVQGDGYEDPWPWGISARSILEFRRLAAGQ